MGGPARFFAAVEDEGALRDALAFARDRGLRTLVIGAGSNLLVADRGFGGLVIRVAIRGVEVTRLGDRALVTAGAGEPWDELVARTVERGLAGLECLSGIPGDVGATPIQNVGAYGQEIADTFLDLRAVDRMTGEVVEMDHEACGFGYRDSFFKRAGKDRFVVTRVSFALKPGGAPAVKYAELQKRLAADGAEAPSLGKVRETVIALRRTKSMVLDPRDENGKSAGSFFMNPTVAGDEIEAVRARVASAGVLKEGERMPEYPAEGGRVKLSAAWLIERAGFAKGTREGCVGISTRHSLALVNLGGATASEVVSFARRVRAGVEERFGVRLFAEPVMVGFEGEETTGLV